MEVSGTSASFLVHSDGSTRNAYTNSNIIFHSLHFTLQCLTKDFMEAEYISRCFFPFLKVNYFSSFFFNSINSFLSSNIHDLPPLVCWMPPVPGRTPSRVAWEIAPSLSWTPGLLGNWLTRADWMPLHPGIWTPIPSGYRLFPQGFRTLTKDCWPEEIWL